jgi:LacI family transcriptional regulator
MAIMIKDIAKKARLSPTTVSLVLNQKSNSRISEKTRKKVLQIAKELGYQPLDKGAQKTRGTQGIISNIPLSIGLVISNITNPFFTELAHVIEDVASHYGYNIILCNTQKSLEKETELLDILARRKVNGLIIAPAHSKKSESNLQKFLKQEIPVVFVDRYVEQIEASAVLIDNVKGAYMAVEHLLCLGHKRIGIIAGSNVASGKDRLHGYVKALKEHHVPVEESLIRDVHFTIEDGRAATKELLSLSPPPSAIFSSGGLLTPGVLLELREQRVRIPNDLSLVSFDDHIWAQLMVPPLTVVAQPIADIGREATQLVIQSIQGWSKKRPQKIVLEPEFIIRKSCAKYSKK